MKNSFLRKIPHFLIPHKNNGYRALFLQHGGLILAIFLLFVFQTSFKASSMVSGNILGYATNINTRELLEFVNQERAQRGLNPLNISDELSEAAAMKASHMFENDYWAHVSPTGVTPWFFIIKAGYDYVYAGENLARDFDSSAEVVQAWMESQSHKENILKKEYTDIGFAVINGKLNGRETTLVVQEFGSKSRAGYLAGSQNSWGGQNPVENNYLKEVQAMDTDTNSLNSLRGVSLLANNPIPRTVSFFMAGFFAALFLVDLIVMAVRRSYRLHGHSFAHLVFLGFIFTGMSVAGLGIIL